MDRFEGRTICHRFPSCLVEVIRGCFFSVAIFPQVHPVSLRSGKQGCGNAGRLTVAILQVPEEGILVHSGMIEALRDSALHMDSVDCLAFY